MEASKDGIWEMESEVHGEGEAEDSSSRAIQRDS